MTWQTPDTVDTGNTDQSARAALHHCIQKRMEAGCRAGVVGSKSLGNHFKVGTICRVHTDTDAGTGNHHIRQTLLLQAGLTCRYDTVDDRDIGPVYPTPVYINLAFPNPGFDFVRATRHQRKGISRLIKTPSQGLPDPA